VAVALLIEVVPEPATALPTAALVALRRTLGRGGVEPRPVPGTASAVAAAALGTGLLPATEAGTIVTLGPKPLARPGRASTSDEADPTAASRRTVGVRVAVSSSGIATAASRRTAGVPAAGTAQSLGQARLCWCAGPDARIATRLIGAVDGAAVGASSVAGRRPPAEDTDAAAGEDAGRAGADTDADDVAAADVAAADRACVAAAPAGVDDGVAAGDEEADDVVLRVAAGRLGAVDAVDAAVRRTGASARAAAGAAPAAGSAGRPGARLTPVEARRWIDTAGRISPSWRSPRWP
jgi:hypothetical protein